MTIAPAKAGWRFRQPSVIPGFGLTLGFSLAYLTLIILIPLSGLVWRSAALGWTDFWAIATDRRTLNALEISFGAAFIAAAVNVVFGTLVAWVLVRYRFPGRRLVDALVDLPFALPTAVAGIALTTLFATNGWFGGPLSLLGIKVAYTPLGIIVAMSFTSIPFIVRTVQPVLEELDPALEEAGQTLGASDLSIFVSVILPLLAPALLAGISLSFARSLGEFGAIIFIAGNQPFSTEITALLAFIRLEEYDYPASAAIASVMLLTAFVMLAITNLMQARALRYTARG
jgi:sulfate/thiosulfate transport system permease protein